MLARLSNTTLLFFDWWKCGRDPEGQVLCRKVRLHQSLSTASSSGSEVSESVKKSLGCVDPGGSGIDQNDCAVQGATWHTLVTYCVILNTTPAPPLPPIKVVP